MIASFLQYLNMRTNADRHIEAQMSAFAKEIEDMSMQDAQNIAGQAVAQSPTDYIRERNESDLKVFTEQRESLKMGIAQMTAQLGNVELAIESIAASLDRLNAPTRTVERPAAAR